MSQRADNQTDVWRAEWMRRAIALARATRPHPNPRVGALVVSPDGIILSERAHSGVGEPHAEAAALEAAGTAAAGGTLVVTLEPCNHTGRTPPCTEAILASGVAKVIVGIQDPDPRVAGGGIARLRAAGVDVEVGVISSEVVALDPGYHHHRITGRPRVTLKLAATLDGQVAGVDGSSQWITGVPARTDAHRLRAESDAVMVGAGTLRADDPQLTVRLDGHDGFQPRPVIVGGVRPLPAAARLYDRDPIVYVPQQHPELPTVEQTVLWHPAGVDLQAMTKDLGERGVLSLMVEGGPTLGRALLRAGLVDVLVLYFGACVGGGIGRPMFDGPFRTLSDAVGLKITGVEQLGDDVKVQAVVEGGG